MPKNYAKTFAQLEAVASKFWPAERAVIESDISVISLLLESQKQFLAILSFSAASFENYLRVLELVDLPVNWFLKHLCIFAGISAEMLEMIRKKCETLFPNRELQYLWDGKPRIYTFEVLPNQEFSDEALKIDMNGLLDKEHHLDALQKDAIVLLLYGNSYKSHKNELTDILARCRIGDCLGESRLVAKLAEQRYLWLS